MICCLSMKGALMWIQWSFSLCLCCSWLLEWNEMNRNGQSIGFHDGIKLKEIRATIIDNHHRWNKSKRFIADGGLEYLWPFCSIPLILLYKSTMHEMILIYLMRLINVRQDRCIVSWESPVRVYIYFSFFMYSFV